MDSYNKNICHRGKTSSYLLVKYIYKTKTKNHPSLPLKKPMYYLSYNNTVWLTVQNHKQNHLVYHSYQGKSFTIACKVLLSQFHEYIRYENTDICPAFYKCTYNISMHNHSKCMHISVKFVQKGA